MATAPTVSELNFIYSMAVGATENARNPYEYVSAWRKYRASVMSEVKRSAPSLAGLTFDQINAEVGDLAPEKRTPR